MQKICQFTHASGYVHTTHFTDDGKLWAETYQRFGDERRIISVEVDGMALSLEDYLATVQTVPLSQPPMHPPHGGNLTAEQIGPDGPVGVEG